MEHCMRPQSFNIDHDHTTAAEQWVHTFKNFVEILSGAPSTTNRQDKADNKLSAPLCLQDNFRLPFLRGSYKLAACNLHQA